jgi:hypothetical protein
MSFTTHLDSGSDDLQQETPAAAAAGVVSAQESLIATMPAGDYSVYCCMRAQ